MKSADPYTADLFELAKQERALKKMLGEQA